MGLDYFNTKRAKEILSSLEETIASFYDLYESSDGDSRKQQALLRSIIVFSCSGIDAIVKQLIQDCLEGVIERSEGALNMLKKYASRTIKSKDSLNFDLLGDLFTCDNPKKLMVESLKKSLTYNSLQSSEELFKVASYFDIKTEDLISNKQELDCIFAERNVITHQFDVDFESGFQVTNRTHDGTRKNSKCIITVAKTFIDQVDAKLNSPKLIDYEPHYYVPVFG